MDLGEERKHSAASDIWKCWPCGLLETLTATNPAHVFKRRWIRIGSASHWTLLWTVAEKQRFSHFHHASSCWSCICIPGRTAFVLLQFEKVCWKGKCGPGHGHSCFLAGLDSNRIPVFGCGMHNYSVMGGVPEWCSKNRAAVQGV